MPNTLAHFAGQGPLTRVGFREVELRWILLGCVIPDIPWIGIRIIRLTGWELNPFDLRLYAVAQASLLMCLFLSAALACLARKPKLIFSVLALGSGLHLLLDALQTKWGNGVHFLLPFKWTETNFGWFWPEHWIVELLTVSGVVWVLVEWWRNSEREIPGRPSGTRSVAAMALFALYLLVPFAFVERLEAADVHSIRTLRSEAERVGRRAEFDRVPAVPSKSGAQIRTFSSEALYLTGLELENRAIISVRGEFLDTHTVRAVQTYRHQPNWRRDLGSYVGLSFLLLVWLLPIRHRIRERKREVTPGT